MGTKTKLHRLDQAMLNAAISQVNCEGQVNPTGLYPCCNHHRRAQALFQPTYNCTCLHETQNSILPGMYIGQFDQIHAMLIEVYVMP